MKKTITQLLLFFSLSLLFQLPTTYAASSLANSQEQTLVVKKKKKQLTKTERKKKMRYLRKKYKTKLKTMPKWERKAFLEDRIEEEKFIPNPWFSLGLTFLILGGVFALIFFDIAIISWMGAILAIIGLGFLVVWVVQDMQRDY